MNVRKFLDEYPTLCSDLPKRTTGDVPTQDLTVIRTETGLVFAVNRKTGEVFRNKKEWSDKDNR
jgi:hypothetical protein